MPVLSGVGVYLLLLTMLLVMGALAPLKTTIPLDAMVDCVSVEPRTKLFEMVATEPASTTCTPFFWYSSMRLPMIEAVPGVVVSERRPTATASPSWQPYRAGKLFLI